MQPSRHSWPDLSARTAAIAVGATGMIVGVSAEMATSDLREVRVWLPDLAVGTILVAVGAASVARRRSGGLLLAATGMTWFIGTYSSSWLFLHRGPLVHAVVTYPDWRPRTWPERIAVAGGYVAALASSPWRDDRMSIALALGVVVVSAARWRAGRGRAARDRAFALGAAAVFGTAVVAGAVVRLEGLLADPVEPMLLVYQLALGGAALILGAGLRRPPSDTVADLVIELGEAPTETLRDALRTTLGDPTLEVGYWTAAGNYVDAADQPVPLPSAQGDRTVTFVEKDSQPFAVLVHDASVLDDPGLVDAVQSTTRLTAANAALQAEVRAQVLELVASRRRLLVAADEERRRLSRRVDEQVHGPLTDLARRLGSMPGGADDQCRGHLLRAESLLKETIDDLDRLVQGLHPRDLETGLGAAMRALAARCPVPAGVTVGVEHEVPSVVATTAYFVVAEALANVAKHSRASRAHVAVTGDGTSIVVAVTDDGRGGADASEGTGIQGLVDRVHALEGTLDVASPAGGGTRLTVELPLDRGPR